MEKTKLSFKSILRTFFSTPAIILIGSFEGAQTSVWKTGKTDFFLKVSEMLMDMNIINEASSNVDTFGHYPCITDLETLKMWLAKDTKVKLYGLDEANIHLPARRAMSTKSVDILQIFPEISKARARLIIIGQKLSSLDSELRTFGWVKGKMEKYDLKTVYISSPLLKDQYWFKNISRTTIKFDPYLSAPFTLKPVGNQTWKDEDDNDALSWAKGVTPEKYVGHNMEISRLAKRVIIKWSTRLSQYSTISG